MCLNKHRAIRNAAQYCFYSNVAMCFGLFCSNEISVFKDKSQSRGRCLHSIFGHTGFLFYEVY